KGGISSQTYNGIVEWFREFNRWMEQSDIGREGKKLTNNIGTSYYLQRITYSRFVGDDAKARNLINNEISRLIRLQFGADGGQKLENKRTRDRKSTRLNSSHVKISYAVFCLKKKKK